MFLLGVGVMHALYAGSVSVAGADIGAPGHDSFYHIAMASLLPKIGALKEFPWLEYVYFRDEGSAFVSHHWGFHVLLMPFVKVSEWTTGDALAGGRWAMSVVFGLNLLLFHLILRARRVPFHWLWLALFFLLPDQFFARHGFVRAIGPSFVFMQFILLTLFTRRTWLAGLAVGSYVHLYLGAVLFGPILVATWAAMQWLAPGEDRNLPAKMIAVTALSWLVGVLTYPYAGGIFEFLRLQIFGSGLSPDIEVGREWKPYSDAWFLVMMAAPLFVTWVSALCLRLRWGPRISGNDMTLMVLQFAFLVLTLKARRFIEYWPPICLLSAAFLAATPLVAARDAGKRRWSHYSLQSQNRIWAGGLAFLGLFGLALWTWVIRGGELELLLSQGRVWALPILILLALRTAQVARTARFASFQNRAAVAAGVVGLAVVLSGTTLALGGPSLSAASRQLGCYYDLNELEEMTSFLIENSEPEDIVFTDDWDIFPPFFYFNSHNHYVVGLDPKFTHQREPDLWNRFVKITRGQIPSTIRLDSAQDPDARVPVALEDIRDHFHAQFVIVDRDHRALSDALADATEFAERIYPESDERAQESDYVVFRVRTESDRESPSSVVDVDVNSVFLSDFPPLSVSQGWGDLRSDLTVDGNTIRLDGVSVSHGLGTHAPSRILFAIPEGFDWFETRVGVDDETDGEGSVVASIRLDGQMVFESPVLRGGGASVQVRVPLDGAHQLELRADPTADGKQFDHVSWGDALLIRNVSEP